ncbi:putative RNA-binding protein Luc7-like 2 isoform X2 [Lineus longissimus]
MDLGECPKIHDLALRADYEAGSKKKDFYFDIDAMEHLQSFVQDCDRRTEQAARRLKETQEELSEEANSKAEIIHTLGEQIGTKLAKAEQYGADGHVEESLRYMEEVEDLKKKKSQAETEFRNSMPASSYQQQKLRVCEICSAYLGIHDNDRRLADHFGGKLHLGFITIRDKLEELKISVAERRKQRELEREERRKERAKEREEGAAARRQSPSESRSRRSRSSSKSKKRSRSRSRNRDREHRRRRSRSNSRRHRTRSRSTSRSRRRRSRSRSRDRRRRWRSRSRSRSHRSSRSRRSRSRDRKDRSTSRQRSSEGQGRKSRSESKERIRARSNSESSHEAAADQEETPQEVPQFQPIGGWTEVQPAVGTSSEQQD